MREPNMGGASPNDAYIDWARENKKRADRLLEAAKAVLLDHLWDWSVPALEHVIELRNAATDYEDTRG